jgi:hypothetical protein
MGYSDSRRQTIELRCGSGVGRRALGSEGDTAADLAVVVAGDVIAITIERPVRNEISTSHPEAGKEHHTE